MDPKKLKGVANWATPCSVTEVRQFLGFIGYYCYFVPKYSEVAHPLLDLTKKTTPWHWDNDQQTAFETLKNLMCTSPVLTQPNFNKQFFLQANASAYDVGAILSQEGEHLSPSLAKRHKPVRHPVAYYSTTFSPIERNYDIYKRELLAVMKSLAHWQQYLGWTREPFIILSDHDSLCYWKSPRNLNRRTARWHADLQEYDYLIQHIPGKENIPADTLSRPPGVNQGKDDNQGIAVIPSEKFIAATQLEGTPLTEAQKKLIMTLVHDHPTAGHPGQDETICKAKDHAKWIGMNNWIADYVKGCATCQQNKILTHRKHTPLYHITTDKNALPFQQIAMDLITGLPKHNEKDMILTIVDHGCSRAAIFLPCTTKITGLGIAQLYMDHMYQWFGLPTKIISNRDPRFTLHFGKALTKKLGIHQNLSTASHPQTDGISERKNQWVKQYLCLVTSASPEDWTHWLAIATTVHNNRRNKTTGLSPNQILLGFKTTLLPSETPPSNNEAAEQCLNLMHQKHLQAIDAINQAIKGKSTILSQYKVNDEVWLEASNLKTWHQKTKLAPKRNGPFKIIKEISPVAYQIKLPASWGIHDVFHVSLLMLYHETTTHGPNYSRPPPDVIEGEKEYAVEKIINHRKDKRSKCVSYLIKWQGYPESDSTWEPLEHIHAPDLLKAYHRKMGIKATAICQLRTCPSLPESPQHLSNAPTSPLNPANLFTISSSSTGMHSPSPTFSSTLGSANTTTAPSITPTELCPAPAPSSPDCQSMTPPLCYPLTLPPVRDLYHLDPPPSLSTRPSAQTTTTLWTTLLSDSSKPCQRRTTNSKSYLTSWSSKPANCWSYADTLTVANPSRTALRALSSTGSTRPFTSASPYRMDTHSRPTGYSVSPTGRSPPCQKNTSQIKSLTWETFMQNPPTTTPTKSLSCPCPTGSTMHSPGQPWDVAPCSPIPTNISHGGSLPSFTSIGKPRSTLCPQKTKLNPSKLRYDATRRYKRGLGAGWRWHKWRKS